MRGKPSPIALSITTLGELAPVVTRLVAGHFQDERLPAELGMHRNAAESSEPDVAFADVGMRYSAPILAARFNRPYVIRCGATMPMNSREVITLVFFQNLGKCFWLPVTR